MIDLRNIASMLLALLFTAPLFGSDVCFVNDSDRSTVITVISGTERLEKRLKPKSHEFVSLEDTNHDRVVIAQYIEESPSSPTDAAIKVVGSKSLTQKIDRRWNFCYVHGSAKEGLEMDLLGFVCLDIVPMQWNREPTTEKYPRVRTELIASLKSTEEINPESKVDLKRFLGFVTGK
jgi:hypothetical protein